MSTLEPCIKGRCYSPTACNGWGYCRERNDDDSPAMVRMRYWRGAFWQLRRMLEHIAETEGDDAAARMRSVAKDALAGKVYAERG